MLVAELVWTPFLVGELVAASPVTLYEPTDVTNERVELVWSAHPYDEPDPDGLGKCYLDYYEVHKSTTPDFTPGPTTLEAKWYTLISDTVYGLTPSTTYYFKVVVVHKSGFMEPSCSLGNQTSNEVTVITLPSAVKYLYASTDWNRPWDTVDLSWNPNTDTEGFEKYVLERDFMANFTNAVVVANFTNQATDEYTVTGLSPNTSYFFRVVVYATTGMTNPSEPVSVTTENAPDAVPVTVDVPSGFDITENSVRLDWDYVYDRFCERFIVERATSSDFAGSTLVEMDDCETRQFTWTDLEPDTTYYFRVISRNTAGNEAPSNVVQARTDKESGGGVIPGPGIPMALGALALAILLVSPKRKRRVQS